MDCPFCHVGFSCLVEAAAVVCLRLPIKNPSLTVSPGLGDGNYVVRATSHNGVKTVLKTRF